MREIKFRAWDSEANIMIYSDHRTRKLYDVYYGFEMNGKGELECRWEDDFTESQVLDGGILDNIMQSTGLKDKNGVEIFEGDVLYFEPYKTHINDRVVQNIDGAYHGRLIRSGYSKLLAECVYETKVIGNIYENSDLLEVSD